MNAMFGAHILMIRPTDVITVPAILTFRHPNLLVKTLTTGPENVLRHY